MFFLEYRTSIAVSVLIIIMGVIGGGLFLLYGVANLLSPNVPEAYLTQNTIVCVVTCAIGLVFTLLAIKTFNRLLSQK
ncbi:MAG: hypothetical protein COB81_07970 [Flavobacteriaceae bacterium]|nr:MAG: hypothetical protein COB81_07970 [Flavobacteriaceae bacterium]